MVNIHMYILVNYTQYFLFCFFSSLLTKADGIADVGIFYVLFHRMSGRKTYTILLRCLYDRGSIALTVCLQDFNKNVAYTAQLKFKTTRDKSTVAHNYLLEHGGLIIICDL
uniref:Uncharacterized protein n=1 Tax=Glossina palpalis gambiensis TaxID=67801 RepID=A0A1B0AMS4_9MUSC